MKEIDNFEDWKFKVPSIEKVSKKAKELTGLFASAATEQEALAAFRKIQKYTDKLQDEITYITVLYSLDTRNKKYEKAQNKLNEILPLIQVEQQEFIKLFVSSKFRPYLEKKLGTFIFQMYEYQLKAFDEKIVEEAQKENELTMKYASTIAKTTVEFRGETYNLPKMGKFLSDSDRDTRHEASIAYYGALEQKKDELEEIYDELIKVRDQMAKKLGYENYVELGYIRMSRYDYDQKMVENYREQIHDVVTPLCEKLVKTRLKKLGFKNPDLNDLNLYFKDGNPLPKGNTDEKVEAAKKMYAAMSPETSYFFNYMVDHHLLFLEAKEGKQSGGYMTCFPVHKCPIIFSNFNGTSGDVDVLTHEFGHSFQYFLARDIKVSEYRMPTAESCEIDSMSMEFFAHPYMDLFFDNPDRYRYTHLSDAIMFLPYGVTVDEFQHWVYLHPNATPAERDEEWHKLELKYTPWKVELEKEIPYLYSGHRWLTQAHIFENPFYYIDYTLAQVLAFQFYNLDRKNHDKAWKKYIKLCKMGGKYPFCELVKRDGMLVPFDDGVLKKTIKPLEKLLKEYPL